MMIAISAFGKDQDNEVNPRLGRCEYFVLYDTGTGQYSAIENSGRLSPGAAGIATATLLNDQQVQVVITGNIGPNAFKGLEAAGIKVYTGASGKVKDVVERYQKGLLIEAAAPNVGPHGR
ncbi:NifB/NifX family molybdenum-iron cluster-binding protein [Desulforamulus aquiferis]|uniref:NifB/NifX family molybdenum-iron cluster-binding protein n=1 Tax=Desulforamulus aquiferis TaxID=1397668 RepID=A0AAW7ZFN7_9FIRM|nr:NifB/NifX family molybdenum-iron cluster-binding protein [Desulforamulus aquiferis]MDO7788614.1 NifB/NifX family molybdenum-iron cluster-binding protein [Desulforamulus aquiferis]